MAAVGQVAGALSRSRSQVCHHLRDITVIDAAGRVLVHMNSLVLAGQGSLKKFFFKIDKQVKFMKFQICK